MIAALVALAQLSVPAVPPARFDRRDPAAHVLWLSPDAIDMVCRGIGAMAPADKRVLGCAMKRRGQRCLVFVPHGDDGVILRHEMGHCHGWPSQHPD